MARTIVDSSELKRLMTEALQAMEDDYQDCQFGGIMKLEEPDEHGCNWSLVFDPHGKGMSVCA